MLKDIHKSSNILESTPLIGSSLAGKISNKINSSESDKDSANSTAKSCVLEYKCGWKITLNFLFGKAPKTPLIVDFISSGWWA